MPNKDGKGPVWGGGPSAGLGRGNCEVSDDSQNLNNGFGRGFGRRCFGRGFGMKRFFSSKNNLEELKNEEKFLQNELEAVQKDIKELDSTK